MPPWEPNREACSHPTGPAQRRQPSRPRSARRRSAWAATAGACSVGCKLRTRSGPGDLLAPVLHRVNYCEGVGLSR